MKNNQKGAAAIILIIIILLAIGGGFYFYDKQEEIVVEDVNATSIDIQSTSTVATTTLTIDSRVVGVKPIYSKNGLSLNLPSDWKVKIDEGKYSKDCDYFTFTPPNYKDGEFFGGFDLCFGKTASNINDWIIKNAPEYKNKVNITKGNYIMGDKYTYFVSEIEDENTGIPFYTNVVLGSKSSYDYHFSQDGANDFPEIIRKNIFSNITIE